MKSIWLFFAMLCAFLMLGLASCQGLTAQKANDDIHKDEEFQNLLKNVEENNRATISVQNGVSKQQTQMVKEVAFSIINLKEENKDLKIELNVVKEKLDSVNNDTPISFIILPISSKKDN